MGWAFSPLDEELGLLTGSLCPSLQRKLVRLSSHVPFALAIDLFKDFCGLNLSRETARRICESAGATYVEYQTNQVKQIETQLPQAEEIPEHLQISADGAMVPLVRGEWAEVKTVAIGAVKTVTKTQGQAQLHCEQLSYFSRLCDAQRFGHLALAETHRRGVSESGRVSAVMDGADWLQGFIDLHCPRATRILDFPHAAQRVAAVGEAIWGSGSVQTREWLAEKLHQLKQEGANRLLEELAQLQKAHPKVSVIEENLNYLKKRQVQMEYAQFKAQGHPLGSGVVESANKLVVEARLKGAGMHWQRANVNSMLGLRNAECNERWWEAWQKIELTKQGYKLSKREQKRLSKQATSNTFAANEKSADPPTVCSKVAKAKPESKVVAVSAGVSKKPAADHPWRKAKIGRARFQVAKAG